MESWVQSWQPRTIAFCDFCSPPVESTALATKKWCQVIGSAAPVTQNHLSKISEPTFRPSGTTNCGVPWGSLERKIQPLCWSHVGPMMEVSGGKKPTPTGKLVRCWGVFWVTFWGYVGPMLGRFGSMLGPSCWVIWRAMWGCMEVSGVKNSSRKLLSCDHGAILYLTETSWNSIIPQISGKHSVLRLSDLFAHLHLLSLLSSSLFFSSLFYSSLLSDPFHLCFSSSILVWLLNFRRLLNGVPLMSLLSGQHCQYDQSLGCDCIPEMEGWSWPWNDTLIFIKKVQPKWFCWEFDFGILLFPFLRYPIIPRTSGTRWWRWWRSTLIPGVGTDHLGYPLLFGVTFQLIKFGVCIYQVIYQIMLPSNRPLFKINSQVSETGLVQLLLSHI